MAFKHKNKFNLTHSSKRYADPISRNRYLGRMFSEMLPILQGIAFKYCHNAEDVNDIVQETALRFFKNADSIYAFNDPQQASNHIKSYITATLRTTIIDTYRTQTKHKHHLNIDEMLYVCDPKVHIEEDLARADLAEKVMDTIHNMPSIYHQYREEYVLRIVEELPYNTVAAYTQRPLNSVKVALHRSKQIVLKELAKKGITVETLKSEGIFSD